MSTSTTSTSTSSNLLVNGLVSGIDTASVINALLQSYQAPVTDLQNEQKTLGTQVTDFQAINSDMLSLKTASDALGQASQWQQTSATSSNSAVATATTTSGTPSGSVSFTVGQLASANSQVSAGSVAASGDSITTASSFLLSQASPLGFSALAGSSALGLGAHTVAVTQASAAAATTGSTAPSASTKITTGSNDTLNVTADGTAHSVTIPPGTYTPSQLAAAVTAAAKAQNVPVAASVTSSGSVQLATTDQGSATNLQVTGGTALSALGLSAMSAAATGTDAVVNVDGTATTLTHLTAGTAVSLADGNGGTISATIGSSAHLSVASTTATNVSTGNGSMTDVVAGINGANAGVTAAAVQTSGGGYVLQLSTNKTGTDSALTVDPNAFAGSIGALQTVTAAANAEVTVGGSNGYTVSSQTDSITGLLPGLTIKALATSTAPVTVTAAPDATKLAANVQTMVDAANKVLKDINSYGGYDAATKTAGPLFGNPELNRLTQQVRSIIGTAVGSSTLGNSSAAGLTLKSDGTIAFDSTVFTTAYDANPTQVANLFDQGGTFTPASGFTGSASLIYAASGTAGGSYPIVISHSATQATDTGTVSFAGASSTVAAAEKLTVSSGGQSVSYGVTAGESLSAIAKGLDQSFAAGGIQMSAQVVPGGSGSALQLTSTGYGSSQSFSVASSGATGQLGLATAGVSGTDVAGTINGVAATGSGQVLSAPTSDPTLAGLALNITASGITSATSIGNYSYSPGLAAQLSSLGADQTGPSNGQLTTTIKSLQAQSSGLDPQIANYQAIVDQERKTLQSTFAQMEAALGSLKNQGSQLSSAINQLPKI